METWCIIYNGYFHRHDIQCREVLSLQVPEFRAIEMPEVVAGFALFEESKHTPSTIFVRTAGLGKDKKEFDLPDNLQGAIRH